MNAIASLLLVFLIGGPCAVDALAESPAGIITNLSGTAWMERGDRRTSAMIGQVLLTGDALVLDTDSRANLLTFSNCDEWALSGPDHIRVDATGIPTSENRRSPTLAGTLDICFDPGSFKTVSHGRLGGVTVRSDSVSKERMKADDGKASAAELLTIVLFDLKNDQPEKARVYYDMLKKKMASGPLVNLLADHFK